MAIGGDRRNDDGTTATEAAWAVDASVATATAEGGDDAPSPAPAPAPPSTHLSKAASTTTSDEDDKDDEDDGAMNEEVDNGMMTTTEVERRGRGVKTTINSQQAKKMRQRRWQKWGVGHRK